MMAFSVPAELFLIILEYASLRRAPQPKIPLCRVRDTQTLLSCSLVSRAWAEYAQSVLFRQVGVKYTPHGTSQSAMRFLASLQCMHNRKQHIVKAVALLDIVVGIDRHEPDDDEPEVHADLHCLANILSLCCDLQHLHLAVYDLSPMVHCFQPEELVALHGLTSLSHLFITTHYLNHTSAIHSQLLSVLPSVVFLQLSGYWPEASSKPPSGPLALRELRYDNGVPFAPLEFKPFLCGIQAPLETLRLKAHFDFPAFIHHFRATLHTVFITNALDLDSMLALHDLPHLRHVILTTFCDREFFANLPPFVSRLSLIVDAWRPEEFPPIIDAVKSHKNLHTLSLIYFWPIHDHCTQTLPGLRDLLQLCDANGIQIVVEMEVSVQFTSARMPLMTFFTTGSVERNSPSLISEHRRIEFTSR